ncbi:MAG: isoprenylcysteine carboxylmethyltransferase family protein [Planctomycetes bacterium]|nr:isoprenylcysteine carboxylmethyltransferase family protein [Planctomycetota bacterium]
MPALLFAVIAYLIGLAGAGFFVAYVVGAGVGLWPREEAEDGQLAVQINFFLLILFAVQHSGMARQTFKQYLGWLGRSIYVAASGITLAGLTWFWQPIPGEPSWRGPIWIVGISLAAASATAGCCAWFDHATFFGLTQAWTGAADIRTPLRIEGPYRYVRHPLMLGLLIALWAQPIMPPELLMLNGGLTVYILFAIGLEERDLLREFPEEYEKYRKEVPALIPWIGR